MFKSLFGGNAKTRLVARLTILLVTVLFCATLDLARFSSQFPTPGDSVLQNYRAHLLFRNQKHVLHVPTSESSTTMDSSAAEASTKATPDSVVTGILLSLFNDIIPMGISLIKELRCLGNHELIQVYHCFPDELSSANRALLLQQDDNLDIIDVCSEMVANHKLTVEQARRFKNWWLKPLALVHTRLQHVLLLDADAVLMQNPAIVRELPSYQETGTMFFYDRVIDYNLYFDKERNGRQILRETLQDFNYAAFNITGGFQPSKRLQSSFAFNRQTSHKMDSSMVFVDKSRAQKAMQVLFRLIAETRHEIHFSHGDKEAFWLAFELAHSNYKYSPWGVSVISSTSNNDMQNHPETLSGKTWPNGYQLTLWNPNFCMSMAKHCWSRFHWVSSRPLSPHTTVSSTPIQPTSRHVNHEEPKTTS